MPLVKTPAIVLQVYPYSDTSLILRYLTPELGVVSVIAKGIRRSAGRVGGLPDVFSEGIATISVKPSRELQTLREFALSRTRLALATDVTRFGGAAVLSELVLKHAGEQPNAELFRRLSEGLDRLASTGPEELLATVLAEAWKIVALLGYEPQLDECVSCATPLGTREVGRFDYVAGGIRCARCGLEAERARIGPRARRELRLLVSGLVPEGLDRPAAHLQLLTGFVRYHVCGGRSLRSLDFLAGQLAG